MINYKKKGISLVESLVALAVGGAAVTGVIVKNVEETEKDLTVNMIHDAIKIVYAVDHRIAIDGYDVTLWNTTNWNSLSEINEDLIQKELTSENNTACSSGTWKPSLNTERDRVLIPCNLFNNRPENGVLMSAELVTDYTTLAPDDKNYIKDFNLYLSFENGEAFRENIKNIKYAVNTFKSDSKKEISGIHNFDLHSISKDETISFQECSATPTDCAFKLSLNRSGGFEYLKIDGSNSMVDSHLSFVETKGQAPMKCQKWTNTKTEFTGVWSLEEVDCGIGIYEGNPLLVEVAAENGTFRNIILDKKCKKYEKVSGKINESSDEVPCGILQSPTGSDTEVIQVVDKTMSEKLLAKELYSKNGEIYDLEVTNLNINTATFESVVSDSTKAEELIIQDSLKNVGATIFNGEVVFNETDIDGVLNFESDLSIGGDLTVKGNSEFLKPISLKDTTITGTLTVNKDTVFQAGTNFSSLTVTSGITNNVINVDKNVNITNSMTGTTGMSAPVGEFDNINKDLGDARTDLSKITPNGESSGEIIVTPGVSFTLVLEEGSWTNKDDVYSCSVWLPETSTQPKGVTFTQTRECYQNQTRSLNTYKVWEDNRPRELFSTSAEDRVVGITQEREETGTKLTGGEGEVGQCSYSSTHYFLEITKGGPEKEIVENMMINGVLSSDDNPKYKKGSYVSSEKNGSDTLKYFELCEVKTDSNTGKVCKYDYLKSQFYKDHNLLISETSNGEPEHSGWIKWEGTVIYNQPKSKNPFLVTSIENNGYIYTRGALIGTTGSFNKGSESHEVCREPKVVPKGTWRATGDIECEFKPSGSSQTEGGECLTNGAKGYTRSGQCSGGKDDRPTARYKILECKF